MGDMASPVYYRSQAQRCLLLSRATIDANARLWFTEMASYYVTKARAAIAEVEPEPSKKLPSAPSAAA
jgi:hypothetical protein